MQLCLTGDRAGINFSVISTADPAAFGANHASFVYKVTAFSFQLLSLPLQFPFLCEMVKVLDIISC